MSTPPTRFDPFIQAIARRAEGIYTKMAIRRDESQDLTRRRRQDENAGEDSAFWEDTTDVSVIALRGFLEDLLGLKHSADGQMTSDILPLPTPPDAQLSAPLTPASHAAGAYRATGRAVHDENVTVNASIPVVPPASSQDALRLGDDFGVEELAQMRGYLKDLAELQRRGVAQLTLRRSLTFLESIDQAIKANL